MSKAKEDYYKYKESVDKGYSGGLIPEITEYIEELEISELALINEKQVLIEKLVDKQLERRELLEGLKKAQQFINNGIEFGFIRLPESPLDRAVKTPGLIDEMVLKYEE